MTVLKKQASALVLALAAASTGAIAGGHGGGHGDTYYPENPTPSVPATQPVNNNNHNYNGNANYNNNANTNKNLNNNSNYNNNSNSNKNYNNNTANANAAAVSGSKSSAELNNSVKVNAAGGAGGMGGAGGAGGNATGGSATGGNANAAGGNANATGGNSSSTGGSANQTNGSATSGNSQTSNYNYKEAKQIGIAPPVYVSPSGDCGTGFGLSAGFYGGAVGGGYSGPQRLCLSEGTMMKIAYLGRDLNDDGMIVAAMEALAETNPEFKRGLEKAGIAFTASCATTVAKRTRVLAVGLTEEKCKTILYSFTGAAVVPTVTAPAVQPVVPAAPPCGGSKVAVYNANLQQWKCGRDLN